MKKNSTSDKSPRKRRKGLPNGIFWLVIVLLITVGSYLIAKPYYDRWQRNRLTDQLQASYLNFHNEQAMTTGSLPEPGDSNTSPGSSDSNDTDPDIPGSSDVNSEIPSGVNPDDEPNGQTDPTDPASTGDVGTDTTNSGPTEMDESESDVLQPTYPTMIVDPEEHALPSEQEVWIRDAEVFQRDVNLQASGDVTLTVIGQMRIPKIDLTMPILDNALAITIRYGLGWYPDAKDFGEEGNAVVFGHRMRNYGEHFNRVGELIPGDNIEVYHDGQIYQYQVTGNKIIEIKDVYSEILNHSDDLSQLVLATCHPIPTFEDYLLVYADLIDIR